MTNWKLWAKGLVAAIINGAAGAVVMVVAVPEKFAFTDFTELGRVALAFALVGAANYLKASPLPK